MSAKKRRKSREEMTEKAPGAPPPVQEARNSRIAGIIRQRALVAVLLFVVSFSAFIPSLRNGLVWDDVTHVQTWEPALESTRFNLRLFVPSRTAESMAGKYFRPVYYASLVLDNRVWGVTPLGFHMTSILLHSVSTVLLYFLILLLFKEFKRGPGESEAFLSCMLFALYPLHVESVSFIAARGDILAGMFFLLCLIFYILSYRKLFFIVLAGVSFYLSFLSKEVAFSFPVIILGFDIISGRLLNRANIIKYIVIGSIVLIYFYLRGGSLANSLNLLNTDALRDTSGSPGVSEFITTFLGTYLFYAGKLLYPYNLNHFIGSIPGGSPLYIIVSVLLIAAVTVVFFVSVRKKENITAFSLLWVFATLGPAVMIAIYPLAVTRFAERFLYVPSMGYCLLLGYLIVRGGRLAGREWAGLAAGGLLCVSFLVVTVRGQEVWRDELTFWEAVVRKSPGNLTPRVNYGEALRKYGRVEEAIVQHLTALGPGVKGAKRGKALAAISLALDYIEKGDYARAETYLEAARRYDPGEEGQYYYYMGYISLKKNDPAAAGRYLEKAVEIKHRNPKAHYLLGVVHSLQAQEYRSYDMYRLAAASLETAVEYAPGYIDARLLLARVYKALGEREKAREQAEVLLRIASDPVVIKEAQSILSAVNSNR